MNKVKFLSAPNGFTLESQVNQWMEKHPNAKVICMDYQKNYDGLLQQSISSVLFFYEER